MDVPKLCPVCSVDQLEQIFVEWMVQPLFDGDLHPVGGSMRVYWCANSHIFMLLDCDALRVAPSALNIRQRACKVERHSFTLAIAVSNSPCPASRLFDRPSHNNSGAIPLPQGPSTLALDDSGERLYWSGAQSDSLSILDLSTRQTLCTLDLGGRPRGMVWDQGRGASLVVLQDTSESVAVDRKLQIISRFKLNASQPTEIVYDAHSRRLYIAARSAVLAINDQDGSETNRVDAPMGVDGLWLNAELRTLYAASPGELTVIKADNGAFTVIDSIRSDIKGQNVAFDPQNNILFLPGGREGNSAMLLLRPMGPDQSGDRNMAAKVK